MLEKLLPKKVKDKDVKRFWKDFEDRSELFLNILKEDEEDSDDRIWMELLVRKGLNRCCIDSDVPFDFVFETGRDPMRFAFYCKGDAFLKKVGEKLSEYYPPSLAGKIDFIVAD